jgi:hypothetical protein
VRIDVVTQAPHQAHDDLDDEARGVTLREARLLAALVLEQRSVEVLEEIEARGRQRVEEMAKGHALVLREVRAVLDDDVNRLPDGLLHVVEEIDVALVADKEAVAERRAKLFRALAILLDRVVGEVIAENCVPEVHRLPRLPRHSAAESDLEDRDLAVAQRHQILGLREVVGVRPYLVRTRVQRIITEVTREEERLVGKPRAEL